MKRFAPLALIVLALALIPAAFADGTPAPTPPSTTTTTATTTTTPAATPPANRNGNGGAGVRMRVELLRLRLQVVRLRFQLHCGKNGNASHDRCVQAAQNILDKLTKLDQNVQQKIADLKSCTSDSTDSKCKNADKKIALLTRIDTHLQTVIAAIQNWLNGGQGSTDSTTTSSSSDGALDQAAAGLSQAAAGTTP